MKLRFKIISHSSQDSSSPITNLILGNGLWQSSRFCQYPQQITIQFYEPVTLSSIHVASHPSKISSKVNILFCLPDKTKPNSIGKFEKIGYFQFADNHSTDYRLRQLKKIQQINQNTQYLRLLLWKNHQNQQNFFNQVGLSQIIIFGNPLTTNLLPPAITNKSILMSLPIGDYIQGKLELLQQFKQQFSKQDDFQSAKQIKQIMKVIRTHGQKLKALDTQKKNAIGGEQYDKAKQLKSQMQELRSDIEYIINNFYDPNRKQLKPILKQTKLKVKMDQILNNSGGNLADSRISNKLKKVKLQVLGEQNQAVSEEENNQNQEQQQNNQKQKQKQKQRQDDEQIQQMARSKVSYENRIIPAVLRKQKKQNAQLDPRDAAFQDNQFIQKQQKNQQQIVLQQMTPSAQANASFLFQFYQKQVVKKLHSKHWSLKLQALNTIFDDIKKWLSSTSQIQRNRTKVILFTFNKIIKQGNFQLNNLNLDLLNILVSSKKNVGKNVQTQLHADLQKSINQICLKMGDSQKIKQKCLQILNKMFINQLYGYSFVYQTIHKSYFNQSLTHNIKIKKYKISIISDILDKYGIGQKNGLPLNSVDFMCKVAEDTNDQIRKLATSILKKMKQKGAGNKVKETVRSRSNLKGSIVKQLQA